MGTKEDVERVKLKTRQKVLDFYSALVLEAYRRVVLRTPVDTGRARGNWNLSTGTPDGSVDPQRFDKSGQASISEVVGIADTLTIADLSYIVNNVHYVPFLEAGSSAQAPQGMVSITVAELKLVAEEMAVLIREVGDADSV